MQPIGADSTVVAENRLAFAPGVDTSSIINQVGSVKEARALPVGSLVGDLHGGLTFTDAVASALEARSQDGWQEIHVPSGDTWTIIRLDR